MVGVNYIWKDKIGYVSNWPSKVHVSLANFNEEYRRIWVTDLAAISRGNYESKNPKKRYQALMVEAARNTVEEPMSTPKAHASRPFEFLPVVLNFIEGKELVYLEGTKGYTLHLTKDRFYNEIVRFSYIKKEKVYTNMRTLINAGFSYEYIPYNDMVAFRIEYIHSVYSEYGLTPADAPRTDEDRWLDRELGYRPSSDEKFRYYIELPKGERKFITKSLLLDLGGKTEVIETTHGDKIHYYKVSARKMFDVLEMSLSQGWEWLDLVPRHLRLGHLESIEKTVDRFEAVRAKIPMFVWAQVPMTHTKLSKESQSDRVAEEIDYWLPDDLWERLDKVKDPNETIFFVQSLVAGREDKHELFVKWMLEGASQAVVQGLLQDLGYRREIWSRAPYYFKYKEVVFTGWVNDPHCWEHLWLERGIVPDVWKNWTQEQTKQFVGVLYEVVMRNIVPQEAGVEKEEKDTVYV